MNLADELKRKRAELKERLQELTREQVEVQAQIGALDRVIGIYDPGYAPSDAPPPRGRPRKDDNMSVAEVKTLMKGLNKRQAVLEILREAREPLTTADCAAKLAAQIGLAVSHAQVSYIANKVSAVLDQLANNDRVRHAGMVDGRRYLWEIAA